MPNAFPTLLRPLARFVLGGFLLLGMVVGSGCTFYRSLGKGQHLDPARPAPHHEAVKGGEEVLIEVTTDGSGAVQNVRFLKPSRSDAVNNYLAVTIRSDWPPTPSTRTVVRIRHNSNSGFGEPEVVSREPAT